MGARHASSRHGERCRGGRGWSRHCALASRAHGGGGRRARLSSHVCTPRPARPARASTACRSTKQCPGHRCGRRTFWRAHEQALLWRGARSLGWPWRLTPTRRNDRRFPCKVCCLGRRALRLSCAMACRLAGASTYCRCPRDHFRCCPGHELRPVTPPPGRAPPFGSRPPEIQRGFGRAQWRLWEDGRLLGDLRSGGQTKRRQAS